MSEILLEALRELNNRQSIKEADNKRNCIVRMRSEGGPVNYVCDYEKSDITVYGDVLPNPAGIPYDVELGFTEYKEDAYLFTREQAEELAQDLRADYANENPVVKVLCDARRYKATSEDLNSNEEEVEAEEEVNEGILGKKNQNPDGDFEVHFTIYDENGDWIFEASYDQDKENGSAIDQLITDLHYNVAGTDFKKSENRDKWTYKCRSKPKGYKYSTPLGGKKYLIKDLGIDPDQFNEE